MYVRTVNTAAHRHFHHEKTKMLRNYDTLLLASRPALLMVTVAIFALSPALSAGEKYTGFE